jgi:hypothetical protein
MKRPGDRLRAIAARVCHVSTMKWLIDPVIADLQCEHAEAMQHGRRWRSLWVRVAGWSAFWRVMATVAISRSIEAPREWIAADDWAVGRTLGFTATVTAAVIFLLNIPYAVEAMKALREGHHAPRGFIYLIPPTFPLAIAVGVLSGVLLGMRERRMTTHLRRAALMMALAGAAASFVMLAWIIPVSNQAFRVAVSGIPAQQLSKGRYELTFGELRREIDDLDDAGMRESVPARDARWVYYLRFALSVVPLVFGWLALALLDIGRLQRSRLALGAVAVVTCFSYYMLLWAARVAVLQGWGTAMVWMPDLVFLLGTFLLLKTRSAAFPAEERRVSA